MEKEEFQKLYEKFENTWKISDEKSLRDFAIVWKKYYQKMVKGELPLVDGQGVSWAKTNSNDAEYLLRFIEWEKLFGKARVGKSEQYMIYHNLGTNNDKKDKYYDGYDDKKYYEKSSEVEAHYNEKILTLLKALIGIKKIDDLSDIETGADYNAFSAKLFLRKLAALHFTFDIGDVNEKNGLLWIYKDEVVDNLYELFCCNDEDEKSFFKKSNAVLKRAVEWINEGSDTIKLSENIDNITSYNKLAKLNNLLWELGKNNAGELTNFDVPNVIYHGAPGTGKTYTTLQTVKLLCQGDNSRYKYCQFHPSYSYQDFIEGIKPMGIVGGNVNLEVVNGIFKQFCIVVKEKNETFYKNFKQNNGEKEPQTDDYPHYYFIVDEINRGDLSRIFGETFSLLEPDYRDKDFSGRYNETENLIVTPLSNVIEQRINDKNEDQPDNAEKNKGIAYKIIDNKVYFGIPFNIHFIGLMNDVDKSIDTFDLALRRRFKWITKECDYEVISDKIYDVNSNLDTEDYINRCKALNDFIIDKEKGLGLSKNYQLGQSYFMKIVSMLSSRSKTISDKARKSVFENYIETTLREYAREVCDENEIDDKIKEAKKAFGIEEDKNTNNDEE